MIDTKNDLLSFRIKTQAKENFKRKADIKGLSPSALLNMFICKYNNNPTETLRFLIS